MDKAWIPIEANPEYMKVLGVHESWHFQDIWSLDEETLSSFPKKCFASILLYPITKNSEEKILGEIVNNKELFWVKQNMSNACGTIALFHCLGNNRDKINFNPNSDGLSIFEKDDIIIEKKLEKIHAIAALKGQTQPSSDNAKLNLHFVVFCEINGNLYEFDGRKNGPVFHGPSTGKGLLFDSAAKAQEFMKRDPEEYNFTLMALFKSEL